MTTAANTVTRVSMRTDMPTDAWAFYCRTNEHGKCSMVCACPHHAEPRGVVWEQVPLAERLQLIDGGDEG